MQAKGGQNKKGRIFLVFSIHFNAKNVKLEWIDIHFHDFSSIIEQYLWFIHQT